MVRRLGTKRTAISAYFLDRALSSAEQAEAEDLLGFQIVQTRIPSVLPAPDGEDARPLDDSTTLLPHVLRAGAARDRGRQVVLVAPDDPHWNAALMGALEKTTGFLPFVVQTTAQREAVGNPGALRVLDAHGLRHRC